jgi:hypothetical protein
MSKGGVIAEPHIVCQFTNYEKGTQALLRIPSIHQASDTGNLICTEVLTFGAFCDLTDGGKPVRWAFLLAGKELSHASWEAAMDSFERNGGKIVTQKEPSMQVTTSEPKSLDVIARVITESPVHSSLQLISWTPLVCARRTGTKSCCDDRKGVS